VVGVGMQFSQNKMSDSEGKMERRLAVDLLWVTGDG